MRIPSRNSPSLAIVCLAAGALWAVDDPSLGKWKVNPAKSVLTDEMKISSLGGNKYSFDFGGGSPETIVADGTDQPGNSGTTMSTAIVSPNEWRGVRKKDGKVQIRGIWTLSKDGNTLHDDFTYFPDNGKTVHLVYLVLFEWETPIDPVNERRDQAPGPPLGQRRNEHASPVAG